jgi:hypothetical protein
MKLNLRRLVGRVANILIILTVMTIPVISLPGAASATLPDWTAMASGTSYHLYGDWGTSVNDVFAVGDHGTILHYNGAAWSAMPTGSTDIFFAVWGSSSTDVFAVGWGAAGASIFHYDGNSWSPMAHPVADILYAVWGSSSTDVFAVGRTGTIMHYNGAAWSVMTSGTTEALWGIWGFSGSDVFVSGLDQYILHFDGSTWSTIASNFGSGVAYYGIWGSSHNDIFAVNSLASIAHFDGNTWSSMVVGSNGFFGVWGTSGTNVFAVGDVGVIYRYNGASWNPMSSGTNQPLKHVWASCDGNAFAVGLNGTILTFAFTPCLIQNGSVLADQGRVMFSINAGSLTHLRRLGPDEFPCVAGGYSYPFGMFAFTITGLTPGQTVRIRISLPSPLNLNANYYKCVNGMVVDCTSLVTRPDLNTIILTIKDGSLGDADGNANGTIIDPGGPAIPFPTNPTSHGGYLPAPPQPPVSLPSISVKSATLSAARVAPGTPVTLTANVANTGSVNGATRLTVYVNGQEESSQGVTMETGAVSPVTFNISRNEPGTYTVYVGGVNAGSFVVDQFANGLPIAIGIGALFLFAFIAVLIVYRRSQPRVKR